MGFPSLKTACMTTPREYMSEAESQLTDRMYSGARYSGLGRQSGGRLGSHSLHAYFGWFTDTHKGAQRENDSTQLSAHQVNILFYVPSLHDNSLCVESFIPLDLDEAPHLLLSGVCGGDAEVEAHDLPGTTLVKDDVLRGQVAVHHLDPTVQE